MKQSLEILRMKKLAGLITEGEYSKALLSEAKNPAKLKMMKNQLEMMLSELDNYLDSNTVDVEEGMMPRIEALIRDINTLMGDRTGLREMEGDVFNYSNLVLGTINRLIDMEEKGENILNILGRISEWNELVDLAREEVGDSFDYSNLVLGTINQLINMGEKGQSVLNILGRISEWNEVVDLAREA